VVECLKAALADRYRIERELGSGGMATVYLAQDLKHERQVANPLDSARYRITPASMSSPDRPASRGWRG
jgi:serine/threonine protein kinase